MTSKREAAPEVRRDFSGDFIVNGREDRAVPSVHPQAAYPRSFVFVKATTGNRSIT
jgi:hypothetical protein